MANDSPIRSRQS